jgi:hypothetical protein
MVLTVVAQGHFALPQPATSHISAEEELRIMELELAILKRKQQLAKRSNVAPRADSVSEGSNTDFGHTDEVSNAAPDVCKYYTVRDGKYYDIARKEQTTKWAKRQRHRQRDEEAAMQKEASGPKPDAKGKEKVGPMAIAGPAGSNSNAEGEAMESTGSNSDAKGAVKEGPMALAVPTGSNSDAEDAVKGTSNTEKKGSLSPQLRWLRGDRPVAPHAGDLEWRREAPIQRRPKRRV